MGEQAWSIVGTICICVLAYCVAGAIHVWLDRAREDDSNE